ncbi:MAG TPA: MaoC family dehydratase N-terminal domain-containing protein [Acidimicrobiia bacterium]|nr:MaoC family dehydratase N-terminal domain-containing protein [Acidimicrobiia bacterium]
MTEIRYGEWGPAVRVRVEHSAVWAFARAIHDENPVYASLESAMAAGHPGIPVPPTFSFAWLHSCALPGLQPGGSLPPSMLAPGSDLFRTAASPGAIYLHGEQMFTWHDQPVVGEVLEGRVRVSDPVEKQGGQRMVLSHVQTVWSTLEGTPVVTEDATYILLLGD